MGGRVRACRVDIDRHPQLRTAFTRMPGTPNKIGFRDPKT
jgi:hypothetical protein